MVKEKQAEKQRRFLGKRLWPEERKLINKIITKQKGYHNKPYPAKDKIPTQALNSIQGALDLLDQAEKKKPNKRYVVKYRKQYEHQKALPTADHEMKWEKKSKPAPPPPPPPAPKKKKEPKKKKAKEDEGKMTEETATRLSETPEQRKARYAAMLKRGAADFVKPEDFGPPERDKTGPATVAAQVARMRASEVTPNPVVRNTNPDQIRKGMSLAQRIRGY